MDKKYNKTTFKKGNVPWNKGLTKEIDLRVEKISLRKEKIILSCKYCKKEYKAYPCRKEKSLYCSLKCKYKNESLERIGKKNPQWKGKKVGYTAIHDWVRVRFNKIKKCERCGTKKAKKYELSNISGKYKRDIKDYERLCTSCHRYKDGHMKKAWITRKINKKNGF